MPKKDDIIKGLVLGTGATLGYMTANGLVNSIAKIDDENAPLTDEQKSAKNLGSIGTIVLGTYLVATQKDGKMLQTGLKGAGVGMIVYGGRSLLSGVAKSSNVVENSGAEGTAKRFMAGALGCPADTPQYSQYITKQPWERAEVPVLRMPMQQKSAGFQKNTNGQGLYQRAS